MKKTIVLIILLSVLFVSCKNNKEGFIVQTEESYHIRKDSSIYISNKENNVLIDLPKLNYIDNKASYVYYAICEDMGKYPIYEDDYNEIYAVTNIKREDFGSNTGLGFYLENEPQKKYVFPLHSKVFNRDSFNKEIYNKINEKLKVKVYVSVYKRDNHSDLKTIVIDSIKLQ